MLPELTTPRISVVIPTYNRSALLQASLHSLAAQTLPSSDYEIVVVNDGSSDSTEVVAKDLASRVRLKYLYITNSGISAAKNLGIFAASAPLLLFFDDDDIAAPTLLEEHLRAHQEHPGENVAILGHTAWAPSIEVTPVMQYIIDVGQQLFAYKNLKDGQRLDYTYFWGGRTSCKRHFLAAHGIFNQSFRAIIEDIELGYRLSRFNLAVIYRRDALSHMVRPITYEDFCARCERQGTALFLFSQLHVDPAVQQYCQVEHALINWSAVEKDLRQTRDSVPKLEALQTTATGRRRDTLLDELRQAYQRSFAGLRIKGIVEAARSVGQLRRQPIVRANNIRMSNGYSRRS